MKNKKSLEELDPALNALVQHPLLNKTYMSGMVFGFDENGEIKKKDTVKFYNKVSGSQEFKPIELQYLNNEFKNIAKFILEKTEESKNNMDIEKLFDEVQNNIKYLTDEQRKKIYDQFFDKRGSKYD